MTERTTGLQILKKLVAWPMAGLALVGLLLFELLIGIPCLGLFAWYGVWAGHCPSGLRLEGRLQAMDLRPGADGVVLVSPTAVFLQGEGIGAVERRWLLWRNVDMDLWLQDADGKRLDALRVLEVDSLPDAWWVEVHLGEVPDGDYTMVAELTTGFDRVEVEVDLPIYGPALAHVLTDRPLVKPGSDVLVRSVTLRAEDRTPIEGRPGTWQLLEPDGALVWEERSSTGAFGMADTNFPIDKQAATGTWKIVWQTGRTRSETSFEVRNFQLPPAELVVGANQPWYAMGERLVVEGQARTMSGAPLRDLEVRLDTAMVEGSWPVPLDWERPEAVRTDAQGRFQFDLGTVPPDLVGRASVRLHAAVVEPGGTTVHGYGAAVLSTEGLRVEAVTELGDGLAGGFNNRAYLRVTTPDGRALPATEIEVSNPWQVDQPGVKAVTDADGVASLQLDPGEPVTVVIPAPPVRARPEPVRPPELRAAVDLEVGGTASAELRRAAELAHPAVATCAALSGGGDVQAALTVQISPVGVTTGVVSADPMGACVGDAMRAVRWPAGSTRTLRLLWHLYDPPEDYVDVRVDQGTSSIAGLQPWAEQLRGAVRACVARHQIEGLDLRLHWRARKGSAGLDVQPSSGLPGEAAACLRAAWSVPMDEPASADGLGVVHLTQRERVAPGQLQAQAQTRMAYELLVQANGAQGRVILPVGQLPDLRIRVEPGLVLPGETVVATMLRGPGFVGELPEHLYLTVAGREVGKAPVRKESRTASFEIPADLRGVATVSWGSAEGLIFVRDPKPLGVQLSSDAASYRPGQQASVRVKTTAGGEPVSAGVGLIGVDAALGQLATLPGPDALGEAFVQLQAARPAFAKFTPAALALGQIKGEHAARAALLRVTGVSARTEQEAGVSGEASTTLEARAELAEAFYEVYEVLLAVVVQWEKSAPEGELMSPPRMVGLWEQALAQVEDRQGRTTDAFGRRLELEVLPDDLLQELDPHRLVSQGTRLSEDVIDWVRFVREETR